jgi:hypothetical protein
MATIIDLQPEAKTVTIGAGDSSFDAKRELRESPLKVADDVTKPFDIAPVERVVERRRNQSRRSTARERNETDEP